MADTPVASPGSTQDDFTTLDAMPSRTPGYVDFDAKWEQVHQVEAATPPEKHGADEEAMRALYREMSNPASRKLVGEGAGAAVLVPSDEAFGQLQNVDASLPVREAVAEAHALAATQALADAAARGAPGPQADTSSATASTTASPTLLPLEQTLANIRMSGERDRRFIVDGSPALETAFYAKLELMGKLRYAGGQPVINLSRSKAEEVLKRVATEQQMTVVQAVKLEFKRDDAAGLIDRAANGIRNALGRYHSVEVFVGGDQATVDARLKTLGTLLDKMDKAGFLPAGQKPPLDAEGKLRLQEGQPYEAMAARSLDQLVASARTTVAEQQAAAKGANTRGGAADAQNTGAVPAATQRATTQTTAQAAPQAPAQTIQPAAKHGEPSDFIRRFQGGLDDAVNRLGGLSEKMGKRTNAEVLLNRVLDLKARDAQEIAKLQVPERHAMVAHVAVIAAKVDTATFGKHLPTDYLDKRQEADPAHDKAAGPSIREKIAEMVATEKASDPTFELRGAQVLHAMEKAGTVTAEQATKAFATLAPGRDLSAAVADAARVLGERPDAAPKPDNPSAPPATAALASDTANKAAQATLEPTAPVAARASVEPANQSMAPAVQPPAPATASEPRPLPGSDVPGARAAAGPAASVEPVVPPPRDSVLPPSVEAPPSTTAAATPAPARDTASAAAEMLPGPAAASAEKAPALAEKLEAIARGGPESLSREDASALIAALDGRRASPLASLDSRSGNQPTETLTRIEGVLNEVSKGRLGDDLKAAAADLGDVLQKWKAQDGERLAGTHALTPDGLSALRTSLKAAESAWHGEAPSKAAGPAAHADVAAVAGYKPAATPAAGAGADAAASERYTQTEMAAGKLALLMANPAGAFTNRDKSWNERNVDAAATALLRVDVEATRQMSPGQRTQLAAYAAWIADNANAGRLPGFDGTAGRMRAAALTERATELVKGASGKLSTAVSTQVLKADRMVAAMGQRSRGLGRGASTNAAIYAGSARHPSRATATPSGGTPGRLATSRVGAPPTPAVDGARLARDVGHAVFTSQEMSEAHAKFILRNAGAMTPEALKSLPPNDKAQAVAGLAHLAQEVRNGALGDFKQLSPGLQRQVVQAGQTANALHTSVSGEPGMSTALTKAYMDLGSPATSGASASAPAKEAGGKPLEQLQRPLAREQSAQPRGMDR